MAIYLKKKVVQWSVYLVMCAARTSVYLTMGAAQRLVYLKLGVAQMVFAVIARTRVMPLIVLTRAGEQIVIETWS